MPLSPLRVTQLRLRPRDLLSIAAAYRREPGTVFLDGGIEGTGWGGWSLLGIQPSWVFTAEDTGWSLTGPQSSSGAGNPWIALRSHWNRLAALPAPVLPEGAPPLPFLRGGLGYLSYDLGRFLERIPTLAEDDLHWPLAWWAGYDHWLAAHHPTRTVWAISQGPPRDWWAVAAACRAAEQPLTLGGFDPLVALPPSSMDRPRFEAAVERIRRYIAAGDVYQANLTHAFHQSFSGDPWILHQVLRIVNPSPYAAFLNLDGRCIVSASPECFVRAEAGRVETCPIKGTRPRGETTQEDLALRDALAVSAKDRAEHLMIVDLCRNDLGRVCEYGSVTVNPLTAMVTHPTVHHLESTVTGRMRPGLTLWDVLEAAFPGGSITGAPKIRAMEIIEELEPVRRGPYTGALGYIGAEGAMNLSMVIRAILISDGTARVPVGGGIVIDSDPGAEYDETVDKARVLLRALAAASSAAQAPQS